jgi:aspartyl-tRNA(Asn)/glutamyl-tRNA(Gln) amidotransferase subunit C
MGDPGFKTRRTPPEPSKSCLFGPDWRVSPAGQNALYGRQIGAAAAAVSEFVGMSVDAATVRRIAHLARIAVKDEEVAHLQGELNAILAFVEQLSEVDVEGVEPMTSVMPMAMKKRHDIVNDGEIAGKVLANAPATEDHFFLVPKVVE